jgi:hypothetical protein
MYRSIPILHFLTAGLPDFSWFTILKWPQMTTQYIYHMYSKCTKGPWKYQKVMKFTKTMYSFQGLSNYSKIGTFCLYTIWKPCLMGEVCCWKSSVMYSLNLFRGRNYIHNEWASGCQIFLDTIYQKEKKYTKLPQNIPNGHKMYQMALKESKCS